MRVGIDGCHNRGLHDKLFFQSLAGRTAGARRGRNGLRNHDTDPGAGHSGRAVGTGRDGRGADRHRQDGGVLAAPAPADAQARERLDVARAPSRACPGAAAHARAGRPGRPAGQALRQVHEPAQRRGVRRHGHEAADAGAEEGRRGAGRHARPAARPHRGQERGAQPGRVRRARRGRPHARHRLPARPAAHPELPSPAAHDAVVLGHVLARDQAPGRQLPAEPRHHRGRAPQRDGLDRRAALLQRR